MIRTLAALIFYWLCVALLFGWTAYRSTGIFPFSPGQGIDGYLPDAVQSLTTGSMMLCGILFAFFRQLSHRRAARPHRIRAELAEALRSPAFFASLLVAPIVFGGVYAVASDRPGSAASLMFAFQNGFFCYVILERPDIAERPKSRTEKQRAKRGLPSEGGDKSRQE